MKLRPYQEEIISLTRTALKNHKRILVVAPTGSGKTAMSAYILNGAHQKKNNAYFCVHRRQLIEQVSLELARQFIPHGFIAAAYEEGEGYVKVAMQQSYVRRIKNNIEAATLLVIDEAHLNCDVYMKIIENNPDAYVILLSATPERLDGKAIPAEVKVETVDTAELIKQGYLCDFKYYAPTDLDFTKLHSSGGEYLQEEVAAIAEQAKIIGKAIDHYKKWGEDGKFINFSYSRGHSLQTAEEFTKAGYPCVHLDCESSDEERAEAFRKLVAGELRGISNVNLFAEGADCPSLQVMIGQSPTKSMMRFRQRIGRVLRLEENKKHAIILDMVNDYKTHDWPDDTYDWQWKGRDKKAKKKEKLVALVTCSECYRVYRATETICPECNAVRAVNSRQVDVEEGELVKLTREEKAIIREQKKAAEEIIKKQKRIAKQIAIKNAQTPKDLMDWAVENGYEKGYGWYLWKLRKRKKK